MELNKKPRISRLVMLVWNQKTNQLNSRWPLHASVTLEVIKPLFNNLQKQTCKYEAKTKSQSSKLMVVFLLKILSEMQVTPA